MDRNADLDKGEIYLLKNTKTGKCYVGQAQKYTSKNNWAWGTQGRWKAHIREALNGDKHCVYLDYAINKYGPEAFEVNKLCDCLLTEMDDLERKYIKEYNTLAPNGYNIREGGQKKPDSETVRKNLQKFETGYKHIYPIIQQNKLRGYRVSGLVDHEQKLIPTREFTDKTNLANLNTALKFIDQAEIYIARNESVDWMNYQVENRVNNDTELLPPYVQAVYKEGKKTGYKIAGFPHRQEDGTIAIIYKQFASVNKPLKENLEKTLAHLKMLKETSAAAPSTSTAPPPEELDMAEIYLIRNKLNGMGFIGRAIKYRYAGKKSYGIENCWQDHLRDHVKVDMKNFPKLYEAMREHGPSNFEIEKLTECTDLESHEIIKDYIQHYNTLSPNGYNLTDSGKGGKKSQESISKMKDTIANKSDEQKKAISQKLREINLGKVQPKNERKYAEDADLPKYIAGLRLKGVLIGYVINKFPLGNGEKIHNKPFKCKDDPSKALERAKAYLEDLKKQYPQPNEETSTEPVSEEEPVVVESRHKDLPPEITPLYTEKNVLKGYKVENREFTESYVNAQNLERAKKYLEQVKKGLELQEGESKRNKKSIRVLPKYLKTDPLSK